MSLSRLFTPAIMTTEPETLVNIELSSGGDPNLRALNSSFKKCSSGFDIVLESMSHDVASLNVKHLPYQIKFVGKLRGADVNETFDDLDSFKQYLLDNTLFLARLEF